MHNNMHAMIDACCFIYNTLHGWYTKDTFYIAGTGKYNEYRFEKREWYE